MTNRTRAARTALAIGGASLLVVSLNASAALADTGAPPLVYERPASDPQIETCTVREGGVDKTYMCMFTSSDLPTVVNGNYYPMSSTYVYTFDPSSGLNPGSPGDPRNPNWKDRANQSVPAFEERNLPFASAQHLWAPTAHYGSHPGETLLFVPDAYTDVTVPGIAADNHPAYIAVASTYYSLNAGGGVISGNNSPWGPFKYWKNITYNGADLKDTYMSDPAIVTLADTHPIIDNAYEDENGVIQYPPDYHPTGGPATWLLWANGDYNAPNPMDCGGLGIGRLNDNDFSDLVDDPRKTGIPQPRRHGPSDIYIQGVAEALGTCPNAFHPYMEGPELYDLTRLNLPLFNGNERFMLMFAAKPEATRYIGGDPNSASSYVPSGHANAASQNQVLAWATSSNVRGPYTYRGILMDSSTTSWTNHGSLYADTITVDGQSQLRIIMFFHDETMNAGGWHERKARAVCLRFSTSGRSFITASRPSTSPDLTQCRSIVT